MRIIHPRGPQLLLHPIPPSAPTLLILLPSPLDFFFGHDQSFFLGHHHVHRLQQLPFDGRHVRRGHRPHENGHGRVRVIDRTESRQECHDGDPDHADAGDTRFDRQDAVFGVVDGKGVADLPEEADVGDPGGAGERGQPVARNEAGVGEEEVDQGERDQQDHHE